VDDRHSTQLTKLEKNKKAHLGLNFSQIWLNSLVDDRHSKIPEKLFLF